MIRAMQKIPFNLLYISFSVGRAYLSGLLLHHVERLLINPLPSKVGHCLRGIKIFHSHSGNLNSERNGRVCH